MPRSRFTEAIAQGKAAVQIAEAANHPFTLYFSLFDLCLVRLRGGNFQRAIGDLERGLDFCRTSNDVVRMPIFAAALGAAYTLTGRSDKALALVVAAVQEFHRHQVHFRSAFLLLCAGTTYLSFGRISEATTRAQEALADARRLGARGSKAHALCLNGDVASARGVDDGGGYYRQALALAEPSCMHPLVAHCHLGLAKMPHRTSNGRAQEVGRACIAKAMYREMVMAYWLERAEAEMHRSR